MWGHESEKWGGKKQFTEDQALLPHIKWWGIYVFYPIKNSDFVRSFHHFGAEEDKFLRVTIFM